jgi:endonuclease/exonuclease/phosphatase family metal-dependent hydrolase
VSAPFVASPRVSLRCGQTCLPCRSWSLWTTAGASAGSVSQAIAIVGERFGQETRPPHFFMGRAVSPFHLDYCFVPATWATRITNVSVGTFDDRHDVSDHAPMVVDLAL